MAGSSPSQPRAPAPAFTRLTAALAAAAVLAVPPLCWPPSAIASASRTLAVEHQYADWLDAVGAVSAIESGASERIAGEGRRAWSRRLRELTARLNSALAENRRAGDIDPDILAAMRKGYADYLPAASDASSEPPVHCTDAAAAIDVTVLQRALYACFDEIGDHIEIDGVRMVRTTALQQLQQIESREKRRRLFFSLAPLWRAVNASNMPDSPYRRMIRLDTAARGDKRSLIDDAAATVGIAPAQIEPWLLQALEGWRQQSRGPPLEPWDYWYASAGASRAVSQAVPREALLGVAKRFYRDLGADLDRLQVQHDLDVRPGKAPLAYTDQVRIGRRIGAAWRPTLARVSANYEQGGLYVLNELIHEDGHAVHFDAVRTRPAYFSLGDDLFFEAFADVPAWSTSEPVWQTRYLGTSASEGSGLRELFSNVMLDVAWSLFEVRMLRNPSADPNAVWTDITSRYLNILPHPELSWWALRVQLVKWPGYMINYGLGSILTADIREHIRDSIGPFDAGNRRWYAWTSAHLLRFGGSIDTARLVRRFLGRPVSPDALLTQLKRAGSPDLLLGEHLGEALIK